MSSNASRAEKPNQLLGSGMDCYLPWTTEQIQKKFKEMCNSSQSEYIRDLKKEVKIYLSGNCTLRDTYK